MQLKTILLNSENYYPIGGGIEQYLRGLGKELQKQRYQVSILTRTIEGQPETEDWPEGHIIRTPLLEGALREPRKVLDRWPEIAQLLQNISPDIVYTNHHSSLALIKASQHLDIPVVYGCHGWGLLCPLKIRFLRPDNSLCHNERSLSKCLECYRMMAPLPQGTGIAWKIINSLKNYKAKKKISSKVTQYDEFQDILESADARIANSHLTERFFRSDKTFGIHLGLNNDTFQPVSSKIFYDKYDLEGPYILVTSRIHNTKGQDDAIRALAHMPMDIKLVLAGNSNLFSGPKHEQNIHTERAKNIILDMGLKERVIFTGFLSTSELAQAYSGALATIVPSVWWEPFGYVTVEAMACGCPVVVTKNCGSSELVSDRVEGYLVPRLNPKAIAEAVLKIRSKREEMGKTARNKVVRELNWPKITRNVLKVFETVIESKHTIGVEKK